jgi:hypothetical protein
MRSAFVVRVDYLASEERMAAGGTGGRAAAADSPAQCRAYFGSRLITMFWRISLSLTV